MNCLTCKQPIKNLTRIRSKKTVFCPGHSDYPNKYHFERIRIGDIRIYPWTNEGKCYNTLDVRRLCDCIRLFKRKTGIVLYYRRHLAGMEVTRLEDNTASTNHAVL